MIDEGRENETAREKGWRGEHSGWKVVAKGAEMKTVSPNLQVGKAHL